LPASKVWILVLKVLKLILKGLQAVSRE